MTKIKITVGTNSEQKLGYLREVLREIGIESDLFPIEVDSGVSPQPASEDETSRGSINRAKKALEKVKDADFGIGIEVGYHKNQKSDFEMYCCTSIADKHDFIQTCYSSRFLLPVFHQKILKEGKYLGDFVNMYRKDINEPVTNYVRELVGGRKPLIVEATRNALLAYLERQIIINS